MEIREDVEKLVQKYNIREVLSCVVDIAQEQNALAILKRLTDSLWSP